MKYLLLFMALALSGCREIELKGDVFAKIYPQDGYADIVVINSDSPVAVSEPKEVAMTELSGWIAVPESQFAKYRRAYEREISNKVESIENKFIQKRIEDVNAVVD